MKCIFAWLLMVGWAGVLTAQDSANVKAPFRQYDGITRDECPPEVLADINSDSLLSNAVLLVFNESSHPLARYEFLDDGKPVKYLHVNMRMNRCTLLYIDTGMHAYHSVYQRLKIPVQYEAGKVYLAHLFTRTIWPLGGMSIIKENEQGEKVEYAAVLFEYITAAMALDLYGRMNKKEIVVNE